MEARRRTSVLLGVGVAMCALIVAGWGLAGRDLAGDEQNMLHGSPGQILRWSLDPRGGFVGHLPLSFWTRWLSLTIFSETPAWAWRLHAVAFTGLTTVITATTAHRHFGLRAGVLAGLLLAVDPIVAFHAQEASNYAASALTGALILRGLLDLSTRRPTGAAWLAMGLVTAAANDFYSVLLAVPALVICLGWMRDPSLRRPLVVAWAIPTLLCAPFVVLFAARLAESSGNAILAVHADPLPPRSLPALLDAPWRVANRFFGAHLHGYAGGRNDAPWIGLPPVLLGVLTAITSLRRRTWPIGLLILGSLLLHGVMGFGLQVTTQRILPYEPRSLIGLTPAVAVLFGSLASTSRTGRWRVLTLTLPVLWLVGTGISTLEARLSPADLRDQAIAHARTVATDAPLIIPEDRTRTRAPDAESCLPSTAQTAAVLSNHASEALTTCDGSPAPPLTHRTFFDAPVHEGSAASFLPRRVVAIYGSPVSDRPLRIEHALLDGLADTSWVLSDADGATISRGDDPTALSRTARATRLAVLPRTPTWLPDHPLLLAHRNQVQAWELDPLDRQPHLRAQPLRAPLVTTLRQTLPVFGLLFAVVALRRRP